MSSSLVLDLQQEVLKPDCDIVNVLRKAHLIASKFKLNEFDEWILSELNGYYKTGLSNAPDYRQVRGRVIAWNPCYGWVPVIFQDSKLENDLSIRKLGQSIDQIVELYNKTDGDFSIGFSADIARKLDSMCDAPIETDYSLKVSRHYLKSIMDKVKNHLIDWTIKLEDDGVIEENISFNEIESSIAKEVPQQIHQYYGPVINGDVNSSQIVSGDNNVVAYDASKVSEAIKEIKESFEKEPISKEDQESAIELLEEISEKMEKNKKPSVIKSAFAGLRDFAVDVSANVTAALITAKIQGLF